MEISELTNEQLIRQVDNIDQRKFEAYLLGDELVNRLRLNKINHDQIMEITKKYPSS